jgi:hypothetical protein
MIRGIIASELSDNNVSFVFPSETAALFWARDVCRTGAARSVAADRFMAWDRFKEETVRSEVRGKRPVSAVLRKLFARALLAENAAAPFLQALVPPAYSGNSEAFSGFLASTLPSLAFWERVRAAHGSGVFSGGEDQDYTEIKSRYAAFLESLDLFEPSWEQHPLRAGSRRYLIFFPEALEDFSEYRDALDSPRIRLVHAPSGAEAARKVPLEFFGSAREELRETVLEIRRLHDGGIPYADMAVSLPGFRDAAPYLVREFSLYDIPCTLRAGKSLGDYGIGRLFSRISECASSVFSFDALKSFVLDACIPWKNPALNRDLVGFGIANHCVSPFTGKGGRTVDVWEEAFKQSGGVELERHYALLKRRILALAGARSFSAIREQYFAFRGLLDMERIQAESDAALARCIEELSVLIEIEETAGAKDAAWLFADAHLKSPVSDAYAFYVSHLNDKNYVPVHESGGVNIYDYPVAAGAPFAYSFVLNASQGAAAVQYTPLGFLRADKRKRFGLEDRDVSAALFELFLAGGPVRFSASEKSFSGWAIPHSFFTVRGSAPSGAASDPYRQERLWWAAGEPFPQTLFPLQKKGFDAWNAVFSGGCPSGGQSGAPPEIREALARRIAARKGLRKEDALEPAVSLDNGISVSATDMTEFFFCPVFWLFKRAFDLDEYPVDAAMLDDASLGIMYHKILQRLFENIQNDGGIFTQGKLEQYRVWAEELGMEVIRGEQEFRSLLAYPLLENLVAAMTRRICALLKTEAHFFAGYRVEALEETFQVFLEKTNGGGKELPPIRLTGKIDRVSISPEGGAVVIDYKTGGSPGQNESALTGGVLKNFQMAAYLKLYEETSGQRTCGAYFFVINQNKINQIVGTIPRKKGAAREKYQDTLDALNEYAGRFRRAIIQLDFAPEEIPYGNCVSCSCKTICRSLYTLNPSAKTNLAAFAFMRKNMDGQKDGGGASLS